MAAYRTTQHRGRFSKKDGHVFGAIHNDRNYDTSKDAHVDESKTHLNWTWTCMDKINEQLTEEEQITKFIDVERTVYQHMYGKGLAARNETYIAQSHKERCKTIEDWLKDRQKAPEEIIYYIGNSKDGTVDPELLQVIVREQIRWEKENFKNVYPLDIALHVDEHGAPHIHERVTWRAHDKDGNWIADQTKALKEMGIERPDPTKPRTRHNNPKITYTRIVREHFQELCETYGLEIIKEPKSPSQQGLDLLDAKIQMAKEELEQLTKGIDFAKEMKEAEYEKLDKKIEQKTRENETLDNEIATKTAQIQELETESKKYNPEAIQTLKSENLELTEEIKTHKTEKETIQQDIITLKNNRKKIAEENTSVREKLRPVKSIVTFVKHAFEAFNLLMQLREMNPTLEEIIDQNLSFNPSAEYYQNESEVIEKAENLKKTLESLDITSDELVIKRGFTR